MTIEDIRRERPLIKVRVGKRIVDAFIVTAKSDRFVSLGTNDQILGEWSWSTVLRAVNENRTLIA